LPLRALSFGREKAAWSIVPSYAKGEMVAIHPRDYTPGGYSTVSDHLCSTHQHYLKRSPAYSMQRAEQVSEPLLQLIQCLFYGGRPPEQNYRTCNGLLSIVRTIGIVRATAKIGLIHPVK